RLEVQYVTGLSVLPQVAVGELPDVRQAATGSFGLALLPVAREVAELPVDGDVRILLVEPLDELVVALGAIVVAPPGEVERDLHVRVELAARLGTGAAAAGQDQRRARRERDRSG